MSYDLAAGRLAIDSSVAMRLLVGMRIAEGVPGADIPEDIFGSALMLGIKCQAVTEREVMKRAGATADQLKCWMSDLDDAPQGTFPNEIERRELFTWLRTRVEQMVAKPICTE